VRTRGDPGSGSKHPPNGELLPPRFAGFEDLQPCQTGHCCRVVVLVLPDAPTANAAGGSPLTAMLASGDHGTVEMESPLRASRDLRLRIGLKLGGVGLRSDRAESRLGGAPSLVSMSESW